MNIAEQMSPWVIPFGFLFFGGFFLFIVGKMTWKHAKIRRVLFTASIVCFMLAEVIGIFAFNPPPESFRAHLRQLVIYVATPILLVFQVGWLWRLWRRPANELLEVIFEPNPDEDNDFGF